VNYKLASSTWDQSEMDALQAVISSGHFTMGMKVKEFERNFANFFGSKYAIMSNSGSSANLLAVAAMRYRNNFDSTKKDVIVPAVSWSTTYYPLHQLGFRLKFVDIDLETLNASPKSIAAAIDEDTAGIFAVNLLGNPSDLQAIRKIADDNNLFLLEDNCESMGAKIGDRFSGTFGEIGTFSTFFSHHISTMEGGVCLTDDEELAQIMTSLRAHGWTRELPESNFVFPKTGKPFEDQFKFVLPGYNLRPLELEAAIGIEQLKKLPNLVKQRRLNAQNLHTRIKERFPDILLQIEHGQSSWFGFSMILDGENSGKRQELIEIFHELEIECRPIVAGNFTKNPVVRHLNYAPIPPLPNSEKLDRDGLFVGNHHYNLENELWHLEKALSRFLGPKPPSNSAF
jgi:CDP-6-deoxy-D-xylo-4-hexulose-3-dehydrase